jgi:hypothetical protein
VGDPAGEVRANPKGSLKDGTGHQYLPGCIFLLKTLNRMGKSRELSLPSLKKLVEYAPLGTGMESRRRDWIFVLIAITISNATLDLVTGCDCIQALYDSPGQF